MAKLLSASSVSAMMTTAMDRLDPSPCTGESARRSGRRSAGRPGSTAARHATPRSARWNPADAADGRYVWLPVRFEGEGFRVEWRDRWRWEE